MKQVLFLVLSLSLSGSILALVLLALKPLVKDRLSKTWQYYLWLIVILRLLLPFTPQTSIMGELFRKAQSVSSTSAAVGVTPSMDTNEEYALSPSWESSETLRVPNAQNALAEKASHAVDPRDILDSLGILWVGGAFMLFAYKVASYRRFVRLVRASARQETEQRVLDIYRAALTEQKVKRQIPLYENNQVFSPMLVGIVRPAIFMPVLEASGDELRGILRHELTHYKRLDFLYKWIVQAALCLHWFNPLVYLVAKQISESCELSCDEAVIGHLDEAGRVAYGDALVASLKVQGRYKGFAGSMPMSENGNIVKERLEAIINFKKRSKAILCISVLLTVLLLCGFAFTGAYNGAITAAARLDKKGDAVGVEPKPYNTSHHTGWKATTPDEGMTPEKESMGESGETGTQRTDFTANFWGEATGDTFQFSFDLPVGWVVEPGLLNDIFHENNWVAAVQVSHKALDAQKPFSDTDKIYSDAVYSEEFAVSGYPAKCYVLELKLEGSDRTKTQYLYYIKVDDVYVLTYFDADTATGAIEASFRKIVSSFQLQEH